MATIKQFIYGAGTVAGTQLGVAAGWYVMPQWSWQTWLIVWGLLGVLYSLMPKLVSE